MDCVVGVFQNVIKQKQNLDIFLDGLREHGSLQSVDKSHSEVVVQAITSLITKSDDRAIALMLLNNWVYLLPEDIIQQKTNLWVSLILKSCNPFDAKLSPSLAFKALRLLTIVSKSSTELTKSWTSSHLAKIYEAISALPVQTTLEPFLCLQTCLTLYPKASVPLYKLIEHFLLKYIDTDDLPISRLCGKCHLLIISGRPGDISSGNRKNHFFKYQEKLWKNLNSLLKQLLPGYCGFSYELAVNEEFAPLEVGYDPVTRAVNLFKRFKNLNTYLAFALCEPCTVDKQIAPRPIIELITGGLKITPLSLRQNSTTDKMAVAYMLPKIHFQLLHLLESLIFSMTTHLKIHCHTILSSLVGILKWSSPKMSSTSKKGLLGLRSKVYDIIRLWCDVMRSGSRCEKYVELLVPEILLDIQAARSQMVLKVMSGTTTRHMSHKARQRFLKSQNENSTLAHQHSNVSWAKWTSIYVKDQQEACVSGLKCLEAIIVHSSNVLKPIMINNILTKLINNVGLFYEFPLEKQHLYSHWECRYLVYKVISILLAAHPKCIPPEEITLRILKMAATCDASIQVRHQCWEIMANLERSVHPHKETLFYPDDDVVNLRKPLQGAESISIVESKKNDTPACKAVDNRIIDHEHESLEVFESTVGTQNDFKVSENKGKRKEDEDEGKDDVRDMDNGDNKISQRQTDLKGEELLNLKAPLAKKFKCDDVETFQIQTQETPSLTSCELSEEAILSDIAAAFVDEMIV